MNLPVLTDTIECSCSDCVSACLRKPGWFLPEEIKPAADLLGLTEKEFFDKHLAVDYYGNPDEFLFVIAPATDSCKPGSEYPLNPAGRCVFLTEDEKCGIHKAKPYECRAFDHRDGPPDDDSRATHKAVAEAWVPHQAKIVELLGREPVVETNPLEMMEFLLSSFLGKL